MASPGNRHCANCIGAPSFPSKSSRGQQTNIIDKNCRSRADRRHRSSSVRCTPAKMPRRHHHIIYSFIQKLSNATHTKHKQKEKKQNNGERLDPIQITSTNLCITFLLESHRYCNVGKPRRSCPGSACLDTGLASGQTRCGGQVSRRHARLAKRVGPRADSFVV